jgi:hypothetical protein
MKVSTRALFRSSPAVVLVAISALVAGCIKSSRSHPGDQQKAWVLVSDSAGGFSVLMPMYPQEAVKEHPSSNGPPVSSHEFIVDPDPSLELGVIYNDYSASLPNIHAVGSHWFFDTVQEGALQKLGGGDVIYARDGTFSSHPMREVCFEVRDKRLRYETRIIVVGHRMYQLIVVSSLDVDASSEVHALFSSFHLLYDH